MTMRKVMLSVLLLLSAAFVGAQTQSPYTHPGKVQIRSTAADALSVAGGVVTTALSSSVVDAATGTVPIVATLGRTGASSSSISRGVALAFSDANNPTLTAAIVGLRPNSTANYNGDLAFFLATGGAGTPATSVSVGMTRRLTLTSDGQLQASNGTISAPALTFASEPTSGFYWDSLASGGFNVAVASTKAARFSQAGIEVPAEARGTGGVAGKILTLGRNSSGNGAPGQIVLEARNGAGSGYIWVDTTGVVRVGTSAATEAGGDTGGTVIGTQTSSRASKHILGQVNHLAPAAMDLVRKTPIWAFTYKTGAFNRETFYGITTDDSPLFGMDQGKSFNPVNAFGATVLALQDVDRRVQDLEARLAAALAVIETLQKGAPQR